MKEEIQERRNEVNEFLQKETGELKMDNYVDMFSGVFSFLSALGMENEIILDILGAKAPSLGTESPDPTPTANIEDNRAQIKKRVDELAETRIISPRAAYYINQGRWQIPKKEEQA